MGGQKATHFGFHKNLLLFGRFFSKNKWTENQQFSNKRKNWVTNCKLITANCKLITANCKLITAKVTVCFEMIRYHMLSVNIVNVQTGSYDFYIFQNFVNFLKMCHFLDCHFLISHCKNCDLDGASSHTDRGSMQMLCDMFGHSNIIGLRTKVFLNQHKPEGDYTIWSPSSPDLNPCDYWGTV